MDDFCDDPISKHLDRNTLLDEDLICIFCNEEIINNSCECLRSVSIDILDIVMNAEDSAEELNIYSERCLNCELQYSTSCDPLMKKLKYISDKKKKLPVEEIDIIENFGDKLDKCNSFTSLEQFSNFEIQEMLDNNYLSNEEMQEVLDDMYKNVSDKEKAK